MLKKLYITFTFFILIAGCSGGNKSPVDSGVENGIFHFGNGSEPQGIDPHIVTGVPEHKILLALLEGLVIFNPSNNGVLPGVASDWSISSDGLTYTFVFNPEAKWTNGESVKPEHFVYSWKRILSPALGAQYADMLYVIKNAENITGKVGENLREEKNVLQRNFFLVSLKNDINLGLQKSDISTPKANSSGLQEFYRGLEFNTFIEHEDNKSAGVEYKSVKSLEELEKLSSQFHNCDYFSFDTETTSLDVNIAQIVGFSFCFESGKAFYVPLEHNESTDLSKDVGIKWL